jgi:hypothetical protein
VSQPGRADKRTKALELRGIFDDSFLRPVRGLWFLNVALTVFLARESSLEAVQGIPMSDALFLLSTVVFFVLGIVYLKGCERLK